MSGNKVTVFDFLTTLVPPSLSLSHMLDLNEDYQNDPCIGEILSLDAKDHYKPSNAMYCVAIQSIKTTKCGTKPPQVKASLLNFLLFQPKRTFPFVVLNFQAWMQILIKASCSKFQNCLFLWFLIWTKFHHDKKNLQRTIAVQNSVIDGSSHFLQVHLIYS